MTDTPKYINEIEVSKLIDRALPTLRNDRFNKRGLPYIKMGRSVRYALKDVVEYMEARKIVPEDSLNDCNAKTAN